MARKDFGLDRYIAYQNLNNSRVYIPVVQLNRFQN